ncbi:hypothetical protein [Mesobacterium pallidum]|uniref:hypothetical protein n=1 Tax=Mesobacterium pallidum TaxID=2872037 RepID=UPI001EE27676|nr:hypothetical protein [Mesobacterium pallidum]
MKGSNSRLQFDAAHRYSNVYQVQGGMITDSDLGEAAAIGLARDEAQGRALAASGVPVTGGMVRWQDDRPGITEGTVFAEGKQGQFRLTGKADPDDLKAILAAQADYPSAPEMTDDAALLYVDVWERAVFAAQDPDMTDAGLHGIETSYRTRTMVQLKTLPVEDASQEAIAELMAKHPAFLRRGTARARIAAVAPDVALDDCDPCAALVEIDQAVPNALFRLEITRVIRDDADKVTGLELAWSMENAAAIEANTEATRGALKRGGAVYQFFSDASETHQGWVLGKVTPLHGAFTADLDAAPLLGDPDGFPLVRRWDGQAVVDLSGAEVTSKLGAAQPVIKGKTVEIPTPFFTLSLPLDGAEYLVGDYWLVEMRRHADEPDRLRLVGAEGDSAPPHGILHHFCPILLTKEGKPAEEQPDWLFRATSFPALSDLPADHVSYHPPEDCPVYKGAETVQQALDAICGLNAKHVHFDPEEGCETLTGTDNVHDALMALCKADDDQTLRLMLRTMADWGVVCGLRTTLVDAETIRITPGTVLNRLGDLRALPEMELKLGKIDKEAIHGELKEIMERHGEVCLSLELTDGEPRFHLSDPDFPYTRDDLTMEQRIRACLEQRQTLDTGAVLAKLTEDERVVLNQVHVAWTNLKVLGATMALDSKAQGIAEGILEKLTDEFRGFASETALASLDVLMERARQEHERVLTRSGSAEEQRQMQYMVARFGILALVEMENKQSCACDNVLPVCPEEDRLALIPIGCVELFSFEPGELAADRVCDFCCRKVSQNWRRARYYYGDPMEDMYKEWAEQCCSDRQYDDTSAALNAYRPSAEMLSAAVGSEFWPPDPGITHVTDRTGPDVRGLTVSKATEVMGGAGVGVVSDAHIDLDKGDIFARLIGILDKDPSKAIRLDYQAKQGDKVGFFTSEGMVRDIYVVQQAFWWGYVDYGALLEVYKPDLKVEGGLALAEPDDSTPWFKDLKDRIGTLEAEPVDPRIKTLEQEIAGLKGDLGVVSAMDGRIRTLESGTSDPRIGALEAEIAGLKGQVDGFASLDSRLKTIESGSFGVKPTEFAALEAKVAVMEGTTGTSPAMEAEMDTLRRRNDELAAANSEAMRTIEALNASVKTMEGAVLRAAPIEDVVGSTTGKALRAAGITTKGQLDAMSKTQLDRALSGSRTGSDSVIDASRNFKL